MAQPPGEAEGIAREPAPSRFRRLRVRRSWAGGFAIGVVAALVAIVAYNGVFPPPKPITPQDVNRSIASALASQTPPPAFSQQVFAEVAPSLVLVESQTTSGAAAGEFVVGSGVVVDQAGDILTCLHVVAGADSIRVTFADGTRSEAVVQSKQADNDIAVLRATNEPAQLVPAVLGNPRSVQIGSEAFALGSPFGLADSMSAGIVSGLDRSFGLANGSTLHGLIQIDAAVNPGNSGGPLVNRDGQVVGIVDALINPTKQDVFIGIGLAVPIDVAGGAAGLPQY